MKKKDIIGENSGPKKFYHWIHSYGVPISYALIWLIGVILSKHFPSYTCLVLFFVILLELLGVLLDVFVETKRQISFISYVSPIFVLYACGIIGIVAILSFSQLLLENKCLFEYFVIGGLIRIQKFFP